MSNNMKCYHVTKDTQIAMKKKKKQQKVKCNKMQSTYLNTPKDKDGEWNAYQDKLENMFKKWNGMNMESDRE